MPQGFLSVSTQPSSQLSLKDFHEWYNEEHIPVRLNRFNQFLSGARYKAISHQGCKTHSDESAQTSWLALYTVESPEFFSSSAYQDLRTNRSDREKNVMSRIEVLTRRTGEIIGVYPASDREEKTTGFKPGRPSGWVVTHGINSRAVDGSVADICSWASHIEHEVAKQGIDEGWARTLVVLVLESGVSRFGATVETDDEVAMPYFAVHEFNDKESAELFSRLNLEFDDDGIEAGEKTVWELYKAYPCLSHGDS